MCAICLPGCVLPEGKRFPPGGMLVRTGRIRNLRPVLPCRNMQGRRAAYKKPALETLQGRAEKARGTTLLHAFLAAKRLIRCGRRSKICGLQRGTVTGAPVVRLQAARTRNSEVMVGRARFISLHQTETLFESFHGVLFSSLSFAYI